MTTETYEPLSSPTDKTTIVTIGKPFEFTLPLTTDYFYGLEPVPIKHKKSKGDESEAKFEKRAKILVKSLASTEKDLPRENLYWGNELLITKEEITALDKDTEAIGSIVVSRIFTKCGEEVPKLFLTHFVTQLNQNGYLNQHGTAFSIFLSRLSYNLDATGARKSVLKLIDNNTIEIRETTHYSEIRDMKTEQQIKNADPLSLLFKVEGVARVHYLPKTSPWSYKEESIVFTPVSSTVTCYIKPPTLTGISTPTTLRLMRLTEALKGNLDAIEELQGKPDGKSFLALADKLSKKPGERKKFIPEDVLPIATYEIEPADGDGFKLDLIERAVITLKESKPAPEKEESKKTKTDIHRKIRVLWDGLKLWSTTAENLSIVKMYEILTTAIEQGKFETRFTNYLLSEFDQHGYLFQHLKFLSIFLIDYNIMLGSASQTEGEVSRLISITSKDSTTVEITEQYLCLSLSHDASGQPAKINLTKDGYPILKYVGTSTLSYDTDTHKVTYTPTSAELNCYMSPSLWIADLPSDTANDLSRLLRAFGKKPSVLNASPFTFFDTPKKIADGKKTASDASTTSRAIDAALAYEQVAAGDGDPEWLKEDEPTKGEKIGGLWVLP